MISQDTKRLPRDLRPEDIIEIRHSFTGERARVQVVEVRRVRTEYQQCRYDILHTQAFGRRRFRVTPNDRIEVFGKATQLHGTGVSVSNSDAKGNPST